MRSPGVRRAQWTRPARHRGVCLTVVSNRMWTRSYEGEVESWRERLHDAVDPSAVNALQAGMRGSCDDDPSSRPAGGLRLAGQHRRSRFPPHPRATAARAKANALAAPSTGPFLLVTVPLRGLVGSRVGSCCPPSLAHTLCPPAESVGSLTIRRNGNTVITSAPHNAGRADRELDLIERIIAAEAANPTPVAALQARAIVAKQAKAVVDMAMWPSSSICPNAIDSKVVAQPN